MASHVQRVNLISHVKEFVDKKGVPVESRLQRSKLLKKVGGFRTYGVSGSLIGDEDFAAANFDDRRRRRRTRAPPEDGEGKYDDDDDDGEEKYAHK
ncbi:hypothetical protein JL720_10571 [Aureococcus anophagefferens]|nr:hypothetical protein JL720_10571 [Aureococcus anophagefferens]